MLLYSKERSLRSALLLYQQAEPEQLWLLRMELSTSHLIVRGKRQERLQMISLEACNEKINAFNSEYKALRQQASKLKEEDKDKMLELEKKWEDVSNRQTAVVKECINQNLNNIVGAQLLRRFESSLSSEEVAKILAEASPVMKENGYTQAVIKHQTAMKRAEVGTEIYRCQIERCKR